MWSFRYLNGVWGLAVAAWLLMAASASAELVLAVDFGSQDRAVDDTGFSANRVQPGFEDFSVGPEESGANGDGFVIVPPLPSATRTFGTLSVAVSDGHPSSNGLFFSDFGTIDHMLGPLADDFVASSGDLVLAIDGLSAGLYEMTTYHHYFGLTDQRFIGEILATSNGEMTSVAAHVPISIGASPQFVSSATFQFLSDGTNETEVVFKHEPPLGVPLLNGFSITRVPEPSTVILAGAILLLVRIRNRRN